MRQCWITDADKFPKLRLNLGCIETRDDALNLILKLFIKRAECDLFNNTTLEKNSLVKRFHLKTKPPDDLFTKCDARGVTSLSSLNTFGVSNYRNMFNGAIIDTSLDVDDWLIHSGTDFEQMFLNVHFRKRTK